MEEENKFVQEEEQRRKRFGHGGEEERKMKRSKIFGEVKLMTGQYLDKTDIFKTMTTPIPCQLRHPSHPPVPSLYLRQSWKPRRRTAGAEIP